MYSALSVANAILNKAQAENKTLTNMQVQKLVFFAHAIYLAAYSSPLITQEVKAWPFGPVIPPLYNRLKKYGNGAITETLLAPKEDAPLREDRKALNAINAAWRAYGDFSGSKMSAITHAVDSPWDIIWNKEDKKFEPIPNELIATYYRPKIKRKPSTVT